MMPALIINTLIVIKVQLWRMIASVLALLHFGTRPLILGMLLDLLKTVEKSLQVIQLVPRLHHVKYECVEHRCGIA